MSVLDLEEVLAYDCCPKKMPVLTTSVTKEACASQGKKRVREIPFNLENLPTFSILDPHFRFQPNCGQAGKIMSERHSKQVYSAFREAFLNQRVSVGKRISHCIRCEQEPVETVFMPCGHSQLCFDCTSKILVTTGVCCTCEHTVNSILLFDALLEVRGIYYAFDEIRPVNDK